MSTRVRKSFQLSVLHDQPFNMTPHVEKGSTVFRPVTKARPRPTEGTFVSQDNRTSQPPSEVQKTLSIPSEDAPAVNVFPPSTAPPHADYVAPAAIANTTKQCVPIVISSPMALAKSRDPPTISASAGPSRAEVEPTHHQSEERSRSQSLAATCTRKARKVRRPTTPAFGGGADPGEELDPTSITMAALCEDTGRGRISSKAAQILDNHLAWRKSNKEKRVTMKMRMEAKKYGRDEDGDTIQVSRLEGESEQTAAADATPRPPSIQPVSESLPTVGDSSGQGFDYSQNVSTSRYNVQVRIGPNGETIVDEESLFVDRNAEQDTAGYTHVEESDVTKFINSATYSKRFRGSRWSAEETELFYDVSHSVLCVCLLSLTFFRLCHSSARTMS